MVAKPFPLFHTKPLTFKPVFTVNHTRLPLIYWLLPLILLAVSSYHSPSHAADATSYGKICAQQVQSSDQLCLADIKQPFLVLNFWASWCGPCREELPALNGLQQHYSNTIQFVGINNDLLPGKAQQFIKQYEIQFPQLLDTSQAISKQLNILGLPSTVVLDQERNEIKRFSGYQTGNEFQYQQFFDQLLKNSSSK